MNISHKRPDAIATSEIRNTFVDDLFILVVLVLVLLFFHSGWGSLACDLQQLGHSRELTVLVIVGIHDAR